MTASLVRIALRISLCQSCPGWRFVASSHASIESRLNRWWSLCTVARSSCAWMRKTRACFVGLFIHHNQSQKENKDGYCIRTSVLSQARSTLGVAIVVCEVTECAEILRFSLDGLGGLCGKRIFTHRFRHSLYFLNRNSSHGFSPRRIARPCRNRLNCERPNQRKKIVSATEAISIHNGRFVLISSTCARQPDTFC